MIERDFDISFIADLARREKQIQQNYRPIIAVHKWFARRPGTLFRGLLLSEFSSNPLKEIYYKSNCLNRLQVVDPFMGGGTPLIEANRVGCDVIGFDINPMSYWIVKEEIEHIDLHLYNEAAQYLRRTLEEAIGHLYRTQCLVCGRKEAHVKYFLWVKTKKCIECSGNIDLFPGYLLAGNARHPMNVFVCPKCGELTETDDRRNPGQCGHCSTDLAVEGAARRNRCVCPHCKALNIYPDGTDGPPAHRLFAIEYYCPDCKRNHKGRFFKKPDAYDLAMVTEAEVKWRNVAPRFVPIDKIPAGDETNRLHRWGYKYYREMFNYRQLLGLEKSAGIITDIEDTRLNNALATNLSDLLRYQNMLCRYDTMALKSLDIFSVHGFPVGLIQCESNMLGIYDKGSEICIGSGGWANIIEKYRKAKTYCYNPFEVRYRGRRKEVIPIQGEWIGESSKTSEFKGERQVDLFCIDSAGSGLKENSIDAVFTDPPYFGNVQYAELMDFCYVWLRRLAEDVSDCFKKQTTRNIGELTGNENMGRGLDHFAKGISAVFQKMAKALKPGSPLAFTYHHNDIKAYYPIAMAILDAGFTCSASFPCPAEMGASIHINGTGSSIIDTIFVCRTTGTVPRRWVSDKTDDFIDLVRADLDKLQQGGVNLTAGDIKCVTYGHLIRLAVWFNRKSWNIKASVEDRLDRIDNWVKKFGDPWLWESHTAYEFSESDFRLTPMLRDSGEEYGDNSPKVSF